MTLDDWITRERPEPDPNTCDKCGHPEGNCDCRCCNEPEEQMTDHVCSGTSCLVCIEEQLYAGVLSPGRAVEKVRAAVHAGIAMETTVAGIERHADRLIKSAKLLRSQVNDAIEILTPVAEKLPNGCECDGAPDGAGLCLPHRAERWLDSL